VHVSRAGAGPFPARDDYAARMQPRLGTQVHRIDRADGGWELELGEGSIRAANAVIAEPVMPS
jgi:hypothetical protein